MKSSNGRKKNYCTFCKSHVTNLCRQIETKHYDTNEGKLLDNINKTIKDSKEKRIAKLQVTDSLRKTFNAEWNQTYFKLTNQSPNEALKTGFIPVTFRHKKTNRSGSTDDSVQCRHCLGMYLRKKLCVHVKYKCPVFNKMKGSPLKSPKKPEIPGKKKHSLPLVRHHPKVSDELTLEILTYMRYDEIAIVAKSDPLILQMGSEFHKSRRHETEKKYCSREMRDMARLLIQLRKEKTEIKELKDCFNPIYFTCLTKAVEVLNGYDPKTGTVSVGG